MQTELSIFPIIQYWYLQGGGICAVRHFANHGLTVDLYLSNAERLTEVAAFQRKVFQSTNGQEIDASALQIRRYDIVMDAMIGDGLKEAQQGAVKKLIKIADTFKGKILSLDVPSSANASTG